MKLRSNQKGLYDYILTKSVMLIFILGLVGIFVSFYNNITLDSASQIADAEVNRIAKIIDDAIGFKGVSNTITVQLNQQLRVGSQVEPYTLEIKENGVMILSFDNYPYKKEDDAESVKGIAKFGLQLQKTARSSSNIVCEWDAIRNGASFIIKKDSSYEYDTARSKLYYVIKVTIDASEYCTGYMEFEERHEES